MISLDVRNVNHALWMGANMIRQNGVEREVRGGKKVLELPCPMTTSYTHPTERVLMNQARDANPFFHLFESLWMLAGRNDLKSLTPFVKRMAQFSDDGGKTQPGAYGHRWRMAFDNDQLLWAAERLRNDPSDRRVVIQMYEANRDQQAADHGGKDIPCNLMALPTVGADGRLHLTVYNRSNDAIWGAYGANAVHFSVLQEYLAAAVGAPIGVYHQVSNNMHAYTDTIDKSGVDWPWGYKEDPSTAVSYDDLNPVPDPYESGRVKPMEMFSDWNGHQEWDEDLLMFMDNPATVGLRSKWLRKVACPMVMAHRAYRDGDIAAASEIMGQVAASDWRSAGWMWIENREAARDAAS